MSNTKYYSQIKDFKIIKRIMLTHIPHNKIFSKADLAKSLDCNTTFIYNYSRWNLAFEELLKENKIEHPKKLRGGIYSSKFIRVNSIIKGEDGGLLNKLFKFKNTSGNDAFKEIEANKLIEDVNTIELKIAPKVQKPLQKSFSKQDSIDIIAYVAEELHKIQNKINKLKEEKLKLLEDTVNKLEDERSV